jgi:DNA invertase Pin-like site-specific DNA recombinase
MGRRSGHARDSTEDQEPGLQVSKLQEAGLFEANIVQASGKADADRPLRAALLGRLCDNDRLLMWKVGRLGRSALDALATAKDLDARGAHIIITTLGIDPEDTMQSSPILVRAR